VFGYVKSARESSKDRKLRIICVPDDDHMRDWRGMYPDNTLIDRVIVSAINDH